MDAQTTEYVHISLYLIIYALQIYEVLELQLYVVSHIS